jgi:enoyl-CoA hydratase
MIVREDIGALAVLRLAHGKVSALDVDLCTRLARELDNLAAGATRAVILTGTGSAFSAGVDLFRVLNGGTQYLGQFLPAMEACFRALLTFPKPLIAAVNGHAIAGGCIIAACCDYRLMAETTARIGVPELLVGVPFPTLPFEIMRARVSPAHFRELVLSGRTVLPADALAVGLVDEVAPADNMLARAQQAAERLAQIPSIAFALTKRAFTEPILHRVDSATTLNEDVLAAWGSAAVQERMRAYLEQTVGKK